MKQICGLKLHRALFDSEIAYLELKISYVMLKDFNLFYIGNDSFCCYSQVNKTFF